jgi:hypothetical protein
MILNPSVPKRYLLLIAALAWTTATIILLYKAVVFIDLHEKYIVISMIFSLVGGLLFYRLLFSKIATKHIKRLTEFENRRYCIFSFFNLRSYLLMITMISMGVLLRKSNLLSSSHLSFLYLMMGIPLLLSALRFYRAGILGFNEK